MHYCAVSGVLNSSSSSLRRSRKLLLLPSDPHRDRFGGISVVWNCTFEQVYFLSHLPRFGRWLCSDETGQDGRSKENNPFKMWISWSMNPCGYAWPEEVKTGTVLLVLSTHYTSGVAWPVGLSLLTRRSCLHSHSESILIKLWKGASVVVVFKIIWRFTSFGISQCLQVNGHPIRKRPCQINIHKFKLYIYEVLTARTLTKLTIEPTFMNSNSRHIYVYHIQCIRTVELLEDSWCDDVEMWEKLNTSIASLLFPLPSHIVQLYNVHVPSGFHQPQLTTHSTI